MNKQTGFSLIEILISSAILVTVLVGLAGLLSYVIRSDTQAASRVVAADLAQQGIDFFRQERSFLGYQRLKNHLSSGMICINELNYSAAIDTPFAIVAGPCSTYAITSDRVSTLFKREAEIVVADEIRITVTVTWITDAGNETNASSTTILQSY